MSVDIVIITLTVSAEVTLEREGSRLSPACQQRQNLL